MAVDNSRGAVADPGTLLGMASEDISGYSLRRGLGSGSAGTVWLLRDLATGRHAVLKRIPKSAVVAKNEFLGDLELARTIDHPHVARLLEVRESDREWLLFSQYVAAGTLTSLLERRGALSPGELVTLISPLAQGLSALHRSGLTHGHLDIDDIMFDADGRPVITDAGLRTLAPPTTPEADLTALGTIAHQAGGTPKTFPPSLFTTTPELLAQQALHRATPLPISLNFTNDPHPTPTPTTTPRTPPTTTPRTPPTTNSTTRPDTPSTARPATSPPPATPFTNPTDPTSPTTPLTDRTGPPSLTTPFTDPTRPAWPTAPLTDPTGLASPTPPLTDPTDQTWPTARLTDPTGPASPTAPLTDPTGPASPTTPVVAATTPQSPSLTTAYSAPGTAPASSAATGGAVSLRRAQPPTRGRGSLPRSAHRGSASRQANRGPARRSALQFLRTKRAAYGILAACGAGAVTTLILGLIAVGVLGHPATSSTAAADQSPQPSTSH
ncbi:MAG: eukaryotic-like serine/threonine-protein kinase, partial [Kribbellaceae bacterium]|nr:eukaryotic-like serine/threonine-protein kinase [Kribbellaceae bacterium]